MANVFGGSKTKEIDLSDVNIYTSKLYELNIIAQDSVREFSLHDVDDKEGLERKRVAMHDAFYDLYMAIAEFHKDIMVNEFDVAYLRDGIESTEGETKQQIQTIYEKIVEKYQSDLANVWMAETMAWLHKASSIHSPFTNEDHPDKTGEAAKVLSEVYTMLEKPFSVVPGKVDGTEKLRRVALGHMAVNIIRDYVDEKELGKLLANSKITEAEFYDEFLNELIGLESSFRQAFNPFDELLWRDILSSFIFQEASRHYEEAIPRLKESGAYEEHEVKKIEDWMANTNGLMNAYLAMAYTDIADAQMRAGNLEDAAALYNLSSDMFHKAEEAFSKITITQRNAEQAKTDAEQRQAQALLCQSEASVQTLTDLLNVNNREEAMKTLKEIFNDLKTAESLAKTPELTSAIKENLRIFSFVEELLKKETQDLTAIRGQIEFAKDLRMTGLIEDVNKALDDVSRNLRSNTSDAIDAIREALISLGILLSLDSEDEEVIRLRNRTMALLHHVKYVIQFHLSSEFVGGVQFVLSRILENLHAVEAVSYYKVINEQEPISELTDVGKLALVTAFTQEAQMYTQRGGHWAMRSQIERSKIFQELDEEAKGDENLIKRALDVHDKTIMKIKQAIAAYQAATNELETVTNEEIKKSNNIDAKIKALQAIVMRYRGDLSRLEGAKNDFMAEYYYKLGNKSNAQRYFSDAFELLREAFGNYNVSASMFQQIGDAESAQEVSNRAKVADLLARTVWDTRQKLERDQEPPFKGDPELTALYQGG